MSSDAQCADDTEHWINDIHQGDAGDTLSEMPESSVHCVTTSPPYFGLRDYGAEGQIGLEESLDEYIASLLDVADEIQRVLRDDGSWWLNLGDSFGDRKQKLMVPHRVALALEDAGWIVRADAVWSKPNPMPHPVSDRLNETKEYIFHLTPDPDYWFDLDAIREPHKEVSIQRSQRKDNRHEHSKRQSVASEETLNPGQFVHPNGKNPGDVLEITVKPFSEAHFAVFPPELCETPIKSSCPPKVCAECGTAYERVTEEIPVWELEDPERPQLQRALEIVEGSELTKDHLKACRAVGFSDADAGKQQTGAGRNTDETERLAAEAKEILGGYFREFVTAYERTGEWEQACDCPVVGDYTEPGIVLDPFAGSGTTCLVAKRLGRRFVGIDLNPEYVAMAQERVGIDVDEPERLLGDGETSLKAYTDGGRRTQEAGGEQ